ncbi:hypothetical protein MLD38_017727 [Melastoma candidum]|uniref:Uncharacterized protein n=1 Tax=Melastoma candidum TaxID=119954 RepID=A0ACB9QR08_9MYRT|nr:hypothetical protein MLD38_017727 [Melastoma candidum]
MDRPPEEMRFMGFVGIFKDSFKIIAKYKKVLSAITISLILPLALLFVVQIQVSDYLYHKLRHDRHVLTHHENDRHLSDILTSDRIGYVALKIAYYIVLLVFSLLSTSAVVYLVASVYTAKPISFKKVMSVVPKVWKKMSVTLIWIFLISFVYSLFTLGFWVVLMGIFGYSSGATEATLSIIIFVLHFVGLVYLCVIWFLASMITVLEDVTGIDAMVKAKDLIHGKKKVVIPIFLLLVMVCYGVLIVYHIFVVYEWNPAFLFGLGSACLLVLTGLFLLGLVVQTVTYFVCKTYHCEHIDRPALAEHLEAYAPNYERLRESKDLQMPQVYV